MFFNFDKLLLNISIYLSFIQKEQVQATSFKCSEIKGSVCQFSHVHFAGPENTFYTHIDPETIDTVIFVESDLQILPSSVFNAFPFVQTFVAINASINAFNYHAFGYAGELRRINVSLNEIQTLVKSSFEGARKLEGINITKNGMQSIGQGTFDHLTYLKYLDLSYNLLQSLPKRIFDLNPQIIEVELSHNRLYHVDPTIFYNNPNLHYLYLDGNRLKDLSLLFSVNSLYHIETEMNDMKHLSLSATKISYPTLKLSIFAYNNELDGVIVNNFHVQAISLFNNSVRNTDFLCHDSFTTMEWLNLERNHIKTLNYRCLNRMLELYELNISENELKDFDTELLSTLKNLKILYTFGNQLPLQAQEIVETFPEMKVMDISSGQNRTRPIIVHTESFVRPLVKKSAGNSASISFRSMSVFLLAVFISDIDKQFNVSILRAINISLLILFCY